MTAFTERSPIETGFSGVFNAKIAPREQLAKNVGRSASDRRNAAVVVAAGAALGIICLLFGPGSDPMAEGS